MVTYFLSFGNEQYRDARERIQRQAERFHYFDSILIYSEQTIPIEFWERHLDFVQRSPRGFGYWIWKHFLVHHVLHTMMNNNDILVYVDCGCDMNPHGKPRLLEYIEMVQKSDYGILSFQMEGLLEKTWTKMDVFHHMEALSLRETSQLVGGIFILKKCPHTEMLFQKSTEIMNHYSLIDDSPSQIPNDPSFREHRHDQSIFSLLRKQMGSLILPDETYFEGLEELKRKGIQYPIWATRNRTHTDVPLWIQSQLS